MEEEEERNKKLRAGKEKLAAFQKKKKAKRRKHHGPQEGAAVSPQVGNSGSDFSSTADLSSSSDVPSFDDSDLQSQSEDESPTNVQDARTYLKLEMKLRQSQERVEELKESLLGKQLALDKVINENSQIRAKLENTKIEELEVAVSKRDQIIQQLSAQLQNVGGATTPDYMAEAHQLSQHVQALQSQLIGAGKLLQAQTDKQSLSSQALQEATYEIKSLQKIIADKDDILNQLTSKLNVIYDEYSSLRTAYETSRLREKENSEVVHKLMLDAEEMRKQKSEIANGHVNLSSQIPDGYYSQEEVKKQLEDLRTELDESYGLQIAEMKQEVVKQQETSMKSLESDLITVKEELENAYKQFEDHKQKVSLDHSQKISELQSECNNYKSQNDELKNKLNTQHDSVVDLQEKLRQLDKTNTRLAGEVLYLSKDNAEQSSEIIEAIALKNQYAEEVSFLKGELQKVNSENEGYKMKTRSLEDTIQSLRSDLEVMESERKEKDKFDTESQAVSEIHRTSKFVVESNDTEETVGMLKSDTDQEVVLNLSKYMPEKQTPMLHVEEHLSAESASVAAAEPRFVDNMCSDVNMTQDNSVQYNEKITEMIQREVVGDLLQAIPPLSESSTFYESCSSGMTSPVISGINDSVSTVTNDEAAKTQIDNLAKLNEQYLSELERAKSDLQLVSEEKLVAQSKVTELSDEILVLKERSNIDNTDSESRKLQTEIDNLLKSNTDLMENVQSATLAIESLESEKSSLRSELESSLQEVIQLLAVKKGLEDEALELREQLEQISVERNADVVINPNIPGTVLQSTSHELLPASLDIEVQSNTIESVKTKGHGVSEETNSMHESGDFIEQLQESPTFQPKLETDIDHQMIVESVKQLLVRKHELQHELENMEKTVAELSSAKSSLRSPHVEKEKVVIDLDSESLPEDVEELQRRNNSMNNENKALLQHISQLEEQLMLKRVCDIDLKPTNSVMENDAILQEHWQESLNENIDQYSRNFDLISPTSQDSLEQEVMQANYSQDSLLQEVVCNNQNSLQQEILEAVSIPTAASTLDTMPTEGTISPDSIDGNQGTGFANLSLDSIESEMCAVEDIEKRKEEAVDMVRISPSCMQSLSNPISCVVSFDGEVGSVNKSLTTNASALDNIYVQCHGNAKGQNQVCELEMKDPIVVDIVFKENIESEKDCEQQSPGILPEMSEIPRKQSSEDSSASDVGSGIGNDAENSLKKENISLNQKVSELEETIKSMLAERTDILIAMENVSSLCESYLQQNEEISSKLRQCEEQLEILQSKYISLQDLNVRSTEEKALHCDQVQEQDISDLPKESIAIAVSEVNKENSGTIKIRKDEESAKMRARVKLARKENSRLKESFSKLEKENCELKSEKDHLCERNTDLETKHFELNALVSHYEKKIALVEKEKDALLSEKEKLEEQSKLAVEQESALKCGIDKMQKHCDDMEIQLSKLDNENCDIKQKLESVTQENTNLAQVNAELNCICDKNEKEKEELHQELRCLSREKEDIESRLSRVDIENTEIKQKLGCSENSLIVAGEKLTCVEQTLDNSIQEKLDTESRIQTLEINGCKLEEEIKSLHKIILENEETLDHRNRKCENLEIQCSQKEAALKSVEDNVLSMESDLAEKDTVILKLKAEVKSLQEDLSSRASEIDNFHRELESLNVELSSKECCLEKLNKETLSLKSEMSSLDGNNHSLLGELTNRDEMLEHVKSNVHSRNMEIQTLQQEINTLQQENQTLQNDCHTLQQENHTLKQKHQILQKDIQTLQQDIQTLEQQNQTMQEEMQALQQECEMLQRKSHSVQQGNQILQQECESLQQEKQTLHQEFQILQKVNQMVKQENQAIKQENQTTELESQTLQQKCETLQQEDQTVKQEYQSLKQEFDILQKENETLQQEKQTKEQEHLKLQQAKQMLEIKCETLQQTNKRLQEENETLQNEYEMLHQENQTLKQETQTMQQENKISKQENQTMQQECQILQQETQTLQQECLTLQDERQTLQQEYQTLQQNFETFQKENETLQQEKQTIENENLKLQQENPTLELKCQTLQQEIQTLNQECQALQQAIQMVKQQCQTLHEKCETLQQENQTVTHENQTMQQENETLQQGNQTMQKEFETVQQETQTLQQEYQTLQQDSQTLQNENVTLKQESLTLQQEFQTLHQDNQTLQKENQLLQKEFETMQHDNQTLQQEFETVQQDGQTVQQEKQTLKHECQTLHQEHEKLQQESQTIQQENQLFERQIQKLNQENQSLEKSFEKEKHCLKEKNDLMTNENKSLAEKCELLTHEIETLQNLTEELDTLKLNVSEKDMKVKELSDNIDALNVEISSSNEEVTSRNQEIAALTKEILNQKEIIASQQEKIESVEVELLDKTANLEKIMEENQITKQEMTHQENNVKLQIEEIQSLKSEIDGKESSLLQLQENLETLKNQLTERKEQVFNLDTEFQKKIKDSDEERILLLDALEKVRNRLKEADCERRNLERTKEKLSEELEKSGQIVSKKDQEMFQLKETFTSQLAKEKETLLGKEIEITQLQGHTKDLEYRLSCETDKLNVSQTEKEEVVSQLTRSVDSDEQIKKRLMDEVANLQCQLSVLSDTVSRAENEVSSLKTDKFELENVKCEQEIVIADLRKDFSVQEVSVLESEKYVAELKAELMESRGLLEEMEKQNESLLSKIEQQDKCIVDNENKIEELTQQNTADKNTRKELDTEIVHLKAQISELEQSLEETKDDVVHLKLQVTKTEQSYSELEQEYEKLQLKSDYQEKETNNLREDKEQLLVQNVDSEAKIRTVEEKLTSQNILLSELKETKAFKEKEMLDLKCQILQVEEIEKQTTYYESPSQSHVIAMEEKDREIKKLRTLITDVQNDMGDLNKQRDKDLHIFEEDKDILTKAVQTLKMELDTTQKEKDEIKSQLEDEISRMKRESEDVKISNEEVGTKYKRALDFERKEHMKMVRECERSNTELTQRVEDLQMMTDSMTSEKIELENKVQSLFSEIKDYQQSLNDAEKSFSVAKDKFITRLDKTQEELDSVKNNEARLISELKEIESRFGEQLTDFEQGKDYVKVKAEQYQEQIQSKDEENVMLKQKIADLKEMSSQQITELKSIIENLEESLCEKENEMKLKEKGKNEIILKLEQSLLQLVNDNKEMKEHFITLRSEMKKEKAESQRINAELENILVDRENLQAEIKTLEENFQVILLQKEETDKSLESTFGELENAVERKELELRGLTEMMNQERSEFFSEKESFIAKYKKLHMEYNALKKDNGMLKRERNIDVQQLEEAGSLPKDLNSEMLMADLSEQNSETLKAEADVSEQNSETLKADLSEQNSETLKADLSEQNSETLKADLSEQNSETLKADLSEHEQNSETNSKTLKADLSDQNSETLIADLSDQNSEILIADLSDQNSEILIADLSDQNSETLKADLSEQNSETLKANLIDQNSETLKADLSDQNSEILKADLSDQNSKTSPKVSVEQNSETQEDADDQDYDSSRQKSETLKKMKQNLEEKVEGLKSDMAEALDNNDVLHSQLMQSEEKLTGVLSQNLNQRIQEQEKEIDSLRSDYDAIVQSIVALKNIIAGKIFIDNSGDMGEGTLRLDLNSEMKQLIDQFVEVVQVKEHLSRELKDSEELRHHLARDLEHLHDQNESLSSESRDMKNTISESKQSLKCAENELEDLRNHRNLLAVTQEELQNKVMEIENKNTNVENEYEKLKQESSKLRNERDELLKAHENMVEDLWDMQQKYENVQSLMEDTKKECNKDIAKLQSQLCNVNKDMTCLKSSLQVLELSTAGEPLLEGGVSDHPPSEQEDKHRKDLQNLRMVSEAHVNFDEGLLEENNTSNQHIAQESMERVYESLESAMFQQPNLLVETVLDSVQIGDDECTSDIFVLEDSQTVECENFCNQESVSEIHHQESVIAVESPSVTKSVTVGVQTCEACGISAVSTMTEYKSRIKELSNEIENLKKEYDDLKSLHDREVKQLQDQIEQESSEARIEEKLKNLEYSMEERFALEFRSKEAELIDKYENNFKTYKKDMDNYVKRKEEAINAEKDNMFIITMRKVKKDYEKRLKKEMKKLGHSKDSSDISEGHTEEERGQDGGELMGAEAEKQILQKENEELEEARDALLQQVQMSQLQTEQLQEELRFIRSASGNSENSTFLPETNSMNDQTPCSPYTYPIESLMLDWELTSEVVFDQSKDTDALEFVEHFERYCDRPQCQRILKEYLKLYDYFRNQESRRSFDSSDVEDGDDETGFTPEDDFQEEPINKNMSTPLKQFEHQEDIPFANEHFISEEFRPEMGFQSEGFQKDDANKFLPESSFHSESTGKVNDELTETGFKPEEVFDIEVCDEVFDSDVKMLVTNPQLVVREPTLSETMKTFNATKSTEPLQHRQYVDHEGPVIQEANLLPNITKSSQNKRFDIESEFQPETDFEKRTYHRSGSEPVLNLNKFCNTQVQESRSADIEHISLSLFTNDKPLSDQSEIGHPTRKLSLQLESPLKDTSEKAGFKPDLEYQLASEITLQPFGPFEDGFKKEEEENFEERSLQGGAGFKPEENLNAQDEFSPDLMVTTPTSELETVFVRQALRKAAEAPVFVRKSRFMSDVPERVGQKQNRTKSISSENIFVGDDPGSVQETCSTSQLKPVTSSPSTNEDKVEDMTLGILENDKSPDEYKDKNDNETNLKEWIEKLQLDKQLLQRKTKDMLKEFTKEKQDLMDKYRQVRVQLENETLSRQHFEQELAELHEDICTSRDRNNASVHGNRHGDRNESLGNLVQEKENQITKFENNLKEMSDSKSKCSELEKKVGAIEKDILEKERKLKDQREHFDQEYRGLQDKVKEIEASENREIPKLLSEKEEMEKEIENLKAQIVVLTSACVISEDKIDLNKQVDNLETKVFDLVSERTALQTKCKELEDLLKLKDQIIMTSKTEMDKEIEQHEEQVLMLSSANKDLETKCKKLSTKCAELDTGFSSDNLVLERQVVKLEDSLRTLTSSSLALEERCSEMEAVVAKKEESIQKSQSLIRTLEDHVCDITATKQDLHLQCTEHENEIRNLKFKLANSLDHSTTTGVLHGGTSQKDYNDALKKLSEMEKILEDKDMYIMKLEDDLDQIVPSIDQQDFAKAKFGYEKTIREQESYIRKLEEHFLRQKFELPTPGTEEKNEISQQESDTNAENMSNLDSTVDSTTDQHIEQSEDIANSNSENIVNESLDLVNKNNDTEVKQIVSGLSPASKSSSLCPNSRGPSLDRQIFTSVFHSNLRSPTSSQTDSMDGLEKIRSSLGPDEDGHLALELKHFELVDEISLLRQEMRETKAVYNQENALLREALDRESVKSKLNTSGSSCAETNLGHSVEVLQLREKVAVLQETNKMLQIENERWLRRVQDQERIVLELRELLGRDCPGYSEVEKVFGKQISLLQRQRDDLVEKLHDHEAKNERLSKRLGDKNVLEESLRREKELLHAKLCEKEDIERELAEKKLELERQKRSQQQLEEIFYHKNLTEKELMRQKRLLEEELCEIECKLREKEELLEIQKNQLLREIKQKESSPPRFLSGSFSVSFSGDDRLTGHTTLCESLNPTSADNNTDCISQREIGRIEVQLQEMEKEHAVAIQNLKEKLKSDHDACETAARQRHQSLLSSLKSEQYHKVPE